MSVIVPWDSAPASCDVIREVVTTCDANLITQIWIELALSNFIICASLSAMLLSIAT